LGVLFLAAALSAEPASAKGPTGYGKVPFGATLKEFQKAYPKAEQLELTQNLGAPVIRGPDIARYALHGQSYPGAAKPIDVEVRFWKGKLWLYIAYFPPAESEAVLAKLVADNGPSTNKSADYPTWNFPQSTILLEKKLGRVTVNDTASTKEAQAWFLAELKKGMASRRPLESAPAQSNPPRQPAATPGK
jgi:hypothetical protein